MSVSCFIACYSFPALSFFLSFFFSPYFLLSLSLLMYFSRGDAPFLLGRCCIGFCLVAVYCCTLGRFSEIPCIENKYCLLLADCHTLSPELFMATDLSSSLSLLSFCAAIALFRVPTICHAILTVRWDCSGNELSYNAISVLYRAEKKSWQILLSRTQAGPDRKVKEEQEEISRNHVPRLFLSSVLI